MNAFAAAEQNGKSADLQRELEALFERENRSPDERRDDHPGDLPQGHRGGVNAWRQTNGDRQEFGARTGGSEIAHDEHRCFNRPGKHRH